MPFTIVRQDITKMRVDAVVNAANTGLTMGGGVCGAVFRAAGAAELQDACDKLAPIRTGEAVITPGFRLPAGHIIHTAGPVYLGGRHGEETRLRACYLNSLTCAVENRCESVAFPLISSGIYGYPKAEALRVAVSAIRDFLTGHEIDVFLAVLDKTALTIGEKLLGEISAYLGGHYAEENALNAPSRISAAEAVSPAAGLDESFSRTLLLLMDAKGKTDAEVYRRANIDRKLFSKTRTAKGYMPSKRTAIALAAALELTLDETEDLLGRAGYTLSHNQKFDVIVEYFIVSKKYDIFEINEALFRYDQPLLGG